MSALTRIDAQGVQTMSSREIAELVESRHADVCRTIERLIEAQAIGGYAPTAYTHPQNGQTYHEYHIGKRDSYVIVAQLSPTFTARLVDRWQELEVQAQPIDPMKALNDPATMRGLLLSYSEKVIELEQVNAELTPKAEALDRIAKADGSLCITDAAKALQIRPKDLFAWLQRHHWIYRRHGTGWLGYSGRVQTGYLEHKLTTVTTADGRERVSEQVRVTPKGMTKLAVEFGVEGYSPGATP